MFLLLIAAVLLTVLVWVGRRPDGLKAGARLARVAFAGLAAAAAVGVGLRGGWLGSLALIAVATYLGAAVLPTGRRPHPRARAVPPASDEEPVDSYDVDSAMTLAEARAILDVPPGADRARIEAAYRRLMRRAHPDQGGSTGLAAKVNAARDRLTRASRARAG